MKNDVKFLAYISIPLLRDLHVFRSQLICTQVCKIASLDVHLPSIVSIVQFFVRSQVARLMCDAGVIAVCHQAMLGLLLISMS